MNIFRKLRKEKNLTQKQLADLLFLDQTTVSKWELGKAIPDYGTLQKLADLYDVTVDILPAFTTLKDYIKNAGALSIDF